MQGLLKQGFPVVDWTVEGGLCRCAQESTVTDDVVSLSVAVPVARLPGCLGRHQEARSATGTSETLKTCAGKSPFVPCLEPKLRPSEVLAGKQAHIRRATVI